MATDIGNDPPTSSSGASTLLMPVAPANFLLDFDAQNIDGLGNSSTQRPIPVVATDNVVAATGVWTFANGVFTQADVGKQLPVLGATNAANNASRQILTVTGATTCTTATTGLVNETFSTPQNLQVSVNGFNAGLVDGMNITNWLSVGAYLPSVLAPVAIRQTGNMIFRKTFASGRAGNLSSIQCDGTGWMLTAAFAALPLPIRISIVFSMDPLAPSGNHYGICDGAGGGRAGYYIDTANGAIHMTGAGDGTTNQRVSSNQLNCAVGFFNTGATCTVNLNGLATSAAVTCTPAGLTAMTIGSINAGLFPMQGHILRIAVDDPSLPTAPSVATLQSYFAACYGSMPQ